MRVDMKRVNTRMKEISGQSNKGVTNWIESMEKVGLSSKACSRWNRTPYGLRLR